MYLSFPFLLILCSCILFYFWNTCSFILKKMKQRLHFIFGTHYIKDLRPLWFTPLSLRSRRLHVIPRRLMGLMVMISYLHYTNIDRLQCWYGASFCRWYWLGLLLHWSHYQAFVVLVGWLVWCNLCACDESMDGAWWNDLVLVYLTFWDVNLWSSCSCRTICCYYSTLLKKQDYVTRGGWYFLLPIPSHAGGESITKLGWNIFSLLNLSFCTCWVSGSTMNPGFLLSPEVRGIIWTPNSPWPS